MRLPVSIKQGSSIVGFVIMDAGDNPIAQAYTPENAQEIKRCLNNHDQVCERLKIQRGVSDSLADEVEQLKKENAASL